MGRVLTLYRDYQENQLGQTGKSDKKLLRRLFGSEHPELEYLVVGNLCIAGYVMRGRQPSQGRTRIAKAEGLFLSTQTSIHPRDPKLQKIPGVTVRNLPQGILLEIPAKDLTLKLPLSNVRDAVEAARSNRSFRRQYPELKSGLRNALPAIASILKSAAPLGDRMKLFIRVQDSGKGNTFYRSSDLYFVVGEKGTILSAMDGSRVGKKRMLFRELKALKNSPASTPLKGARFFPPDKRHIISIKSGGRIYRTEPRAIDMLFGEIFRSKKLRSKLPARFSVVDLLQFFVNQFRGSSQKGGVKTIRMPKKNILVRAETRESGGLEFLVINGNTIYSCRRRRTSPAQPIKSANETT